MTFDRTPSTERDFLTARATVAALRTRRQQLIEKLARTSDPLTRRAIGADLMSTDGALDRAVPALTAARVRLERSEKRRATP